MGLESRSFKEELTFCIRDEDARLIVDFHKLVTKLPRNFVPAEERALVGPKCNVTV